MISVIFADGGIKPWSLHRVTRHAASSQGCVQEKAGSLRLPPQGRRHDRFCLAVDRFGVWRGSRLSGCVGGVDFVVAAWVA